MSSTNYSLTLNKIWQFILQVSYFFQLLHALLTTIEMFVWCKLLGVVPYSITIGWKSLGTLILTPPPFLSMGMRNTTKMWGSMFWVPPMELYRIISSNLSSIWISWFLLSGILVIFVHILSPCGTCIFRSFLYDFFPLCTTSTFCPLNLCSNSYFVLT